MFANAHRVVARRSAIQATVLSTSAVLMLSTGCSMSHRSDNVRTKSLSAADLIEDCTSAFTNADTIRARGRLILHSDEQDRTRLVSWEFARPQRTRLRVGERVAVIRDGEWFHYDPDRDTYRRHPGLGGDPIQTAVYFMTDGAPMPEVAIPMRGSAALGVKDANAWRLNGVRWVSQRPCYVLLHPYSADRKDLEMAIYVDQETRLLRGWAVQQLGADVDDAPIVSCEYDAIELNAQIADDQFATRQSSVRTVARATQKRR